MFLSPSSLSIPRLLWLTVWASVFVSVSAIKTVQTSSSDTNSAWQGAPWQSSTDSRSILEQGIYQDLPPTIFSPTGRLHAVEGVVGAAKLNQPRSNLVVALHCRDGLVVISTLPTSPHLNTTATNNNNSTSTSTLWLVKDTATTPIVDLSPCITAATAGNAVDGQVLRTKLQAYAEYAMETQGQHPHSIQASELARRVADHLQTPTQTVGGRGGRLLAVSSSLETSLCENMHTLLLLLLLLYTSENLIIF
jgi:hypothetical protein